MGLTEEIKNALKSEYSYPNLTNEGIEEWTANWLILMDEDEYWEKLFQELYIQ